MLTLLRFVEAAHVRRNVTITMMGVPDVHVNVVPMARALPNVLDLPLISGFVKSSIAAALNEYVAPKSMTLNVADMISGAPPGKDVNAIGVLVVHIQRGIDLSAQDASGSSDPYVVISLAKFGKPLYSSRIIFEDLNPNWNEYAFVPITKDDLANDEVLSVQLWDSDKRTADDIVGRISRNVGELTKGETRNKMVEYRDELKGFEDADKMQGAWCVPATCASG
jgi:Ca2+-dependent lipid-binding protein